VILKLTVNDMLAVVYQDDDGQSEVQGQHWISESLGRSKSRSNYSSDGLGFKQQFDEVIARVDELD
jgi:hypothetical protein